MLQTADGVMLSAEFGRHIRFTVDDYGALAKPRRTDSADHAAGGGGGRSLSVSCSASFTSSGGSGLAGIDAARTALSESSPKLTKLVPTTSKTSCEASAY